MTDSYKHGPSHGNYKHGRPPEYGVWINLKSRCYNKKDANYHRYGARGIRVCSRWLGPDGFNNFLLDVGRRPDGKYPSGRAMYSIDRINNNGDYCPENCRWTTMEKQSNNRSTNNVIKGKTIAEWGKELGGSRYLIRRRLKMGWSVEDAVSVPLGNPGLDRKSIHRANQVDVTYNGKTQSLKAWSRELGVSYPAICKRIDSYGWDPIKAITTPVKKINSC